MNTSEAGVKLVKLFEGLSLCTYKSPTGGLTVGYGHTGPDVVEGGRVTEQQAEKLLKNDLVDSEKAVRSLVKIPLNQNQFDALVSFTYNIGINAFKESTLLKRLNTERDLCNAVKEELPKWIKGSENRVLEGLICRRRAEIEFFCKELAKNAEINSVLSIRSKVQTWLKKEPVPASKLGNNKKAIILQGRTINNCKVLTHKDGHTQLELGFGLGVWWLFDDHWEGLKTDCSVGKAAVKGDLVCLRSFPYFYQQDNGPEGWRQCQSSCIAMALKYLDVKGIDDDVDYVKYVVKHGDTTERYPHFEALKDLNVGAKFKVNLDIQDVKEQIDKGLPVVAGILHKGHYSAPSGRGHFIVITGYSNSYWLVQDPFGKLDLVNGQWADTSPTAGKNQKYLFTTLNPRFFVSGSTNGWGWVDFKYPG